MSSSLEEFFEEAGEIPAREVPEARTTYSEQELREMVLRDVEEFTRADTREKKFLVMNRRRLDFIRERREKLRETWERVGSFSYHPERFDPGKVDPELVFCDGNARANELWVYYRVMASSLQYTGYYGRKIRYLVFDRNSGTPMGLVGLGSDFMGLGPRDQYIGWSRANRFGRLVDQEGRPSAKKYHSWDEMKELGVRKVDNRINNLMNIFVCVGIEPFNRILVGKLLAMSAFSDEVLTRFQKEYRQPLAGITTTSIYGESIQYDRLKPYLVYLGLSRGIGTVQFSKEVVEALKRYYFENVSREPLTRLGLQPKGKMIQIVCKRLGLSSKIMEHHHQRGIYFGYSFENSKEFLNGKTDEGGLRPFPHRSFREISDFWRARWMVKGVGKLQSLGDFVGFYDVERVLERVRASGGGA